MAKTRTYNPKLIKAALGNHMVDGYADDSFITISALGDGTTSKVGCDGSVVRSVSPDQRYSVKLALWQGSSTDAYLEKQHQMDVEDGDGMFSIIIKDLAGGKIFSAENAWVTKDPDMVYGKEAGSREWELNTDGGEWEDS